MPLLLLLPPRPPLPATPPLTTYTPIKCTMEDCTFSTDTYTDFLFIACRFLLYYFYISLTPALQVAIKKNHSVMVGLFPFSIAIGALCDWPYDSVLCSDWL